MDILNLLQSTLSSEVIQTLGTSIGTDTGTTKKALTTILPKLLEGLTKNTSSPEGATQLDTALNDHTNTLSNLGDILSGNMDKDGRGILGHIFSQKSDAIAQEIATKTGLSTEQSEKLMTTLAPLVMGALGKAKQDGSLTSDNLSTTLSDLTTKSAPLLGAFFDQDGDGDFDRKDALSVGLKFLKKFFSK